jgi:hypothetical protein
MTQKLPNSGFDADAMQLAHEECKIFEKVWFTPAAALEPFRCAARITK